MDLVKSLSVVLADVFVLYMETHNFHINIVGKDFPQLHKMFKDQYEDIHESVDRWGESIRTLNEITPFSLSEFEKLSNITSSGKIPSSMMVKILANGHSTVIQDINNAIKIAEKLNKQGIINICSERIEIHEKWQWQLKAFLSNEITTARLISYLY